MTRFSKADARRIIDEEVALLGLEFAAFEVKDGPRSGANDLDWWHENTPASERADTKYNLAHLRAYLRISGSETLPAVGIPLDRRRLWMDRSVISRLARDGYLDFKPANYSTFSLSEKGRKWIVEGEPKI